MSAPFLSRLLCWVIAGSLIVGLTIKPAAMAAESPKPLATPSVKAVTPVTSAAMPAATASPPAPNGIPVGTVINVQNWQTYKDFMTDGMAALFQGQYYWKMPPEVQIEVGPTVIDPQPKNYLEATENHAAQVKLVDLPDGRLSIANYQDGRPFPNPEEPHKGFKVLANVWFRYLPHIIVDHYGTGCTVDAYGSINCTADEIIYRQLSYNTDPGVPAMTANAEGKFYTEYVMTEYPESERYNASLTISYNDLTRLEDVYVFIPSLRRYQPVSAAARCSPSAGTDATLDDFRFGFDSNLTQVTVDFVGSKKVLALVDAALPQTTFPDGYSMPLGWPKPSWGKWQVRDVDVISVSKVPAFAKGYCYGKRVMYVDAAFSAPVWEDLYDSDMKLWKFFGLFLAKLDVPGAGPVSTAGSQVEAFWDIQNHHATFFSDPGMGGPFYTNSQAPERYEDLTRYTTPGGLNMIMR